MKHSMMNHNNDMDMSHSYNDYSSSMNHADESNMCAMNMSFTWSYKNICIIFPWWHIKDITHLAFSCIVIICWACFYEYLKYYIKISSKSQSISSANGNYRSIQWKKSLWYGLQVGLSFLLMLVFMTYNGWLMLSVVMGATLGYYYWGSYADEYNNSSLACH